MIEKTVSISPTTGVEYELPATSDDSIEIEKFVANNKEKPVVAVQGLGFVGSVMSLVIANEAQFTVLGVDLSTAGAYWRIGDLNAGTFPVISSDEKLQKYWQQVKQNQNFLATHDPNAFASADVIIVDVNLDVKKTETPDGIDFDVDLAPFKDAISTIGRHCQPDVLVIVETTVPPGACKNIVWPTLQSLLHKRGLPTDKIKLGHSYERVMPGPNYVDSIENFYRVFSGVNEASAKATEEFLKSIIKTDQFPLTRLDNTTATETAKVLENSYRAMNIAFVSEWAKFAEKAEINLFEVIDAIRLRPTHSNLMRPGLGVGGYCLTKDPLLASWASSQFFDLSEGLPQSEKSVFINDRMPLASFELLRTSLKRSLKDSRVLLLGVSYLNDVGDTRFTPVRLLYEELSRAGAVISLHDPYVSNWEELQVDVEQQLSSVMASEYDVVVFTAGHALYRNNSKLIETLKNQDDVLVVDTIGVLNNTEISEIMRSHQVKVVGRGDI